ncbi:MAG TPA: hypothetical protein VNK44_04100 [Candidatus Nitrosotenuis sp.]|nr:hypothetical protein [Candidatus Nitrosotenuis sp.]
MSIVSRPFFVYITMVALAVYGIISLIILGILISIVSSAPPMVMFQLGALVAAAYAISIAVALINFGLAYLAYIGKSWGRWVIVGFTILTLGGSIMNIVNYGGFAGLSSLASTLIGLAVTTTIMSVIILYAMFRKDVKNYFSKSKVVM